MKGAGFFAVLFISWQVVRELVPEMSGGIGGMLFGCLGVFLAYKLLSQSPGLPAGSDTERRKADSDGRD
jgi:hypothetical protein